jgi:hypothetical protein
MILMKKRFFVDTISPKRSLRLILAAFGVSCVECLFHVALHARLWAILSKTKPSRTGRFWVFREYIKLRATPRYRLRTVFWLSSVVTTTCAFLSLAMVILGLLSNPS